MKQVLRSAAILVLAIVLAQGAQAQGTQDPGWSARLSATTILGTAGGSFDPELGWGVGIEYRFSRRLGVELGISQADVVNSVEAGFIIAAPFTIESRLSAMPLLAQLDIHLTPDSPVDLYLGPVVGYIRYGDLETRIRGFEGETIPVVVTPVDDGFAWGVHAGLDVPLGRSRSFFEAGISYLDAKAESSLGLAADNDLVFDIDPLVIRAGIGMRF